MDNFKILTEYSPWFILLCLLAGAAYAFILYKKDAPWSKTVNKILAGLRFILVAILCFLLLGPFVKHFKNYFEKPAVVFAIDNSQSIKFVTDSVFIKSLKNSLSELSKNLKDEDAEIDIHLLQNEEKINDINDLNFDQPSTNLSQMLTDIHSIYENRNLAGVVLVSDGIFNQGIAPYYKDYSFPVYSVGIGDTIARKDINLKQLYYNKLSFVGNKFPLVAEIHNKGFKGENISVILKKNNEVIETKTVAILRENDIIEVEFQLSSDKKGMQHYVVEVKPVKGEFTPKNNVAHAYIDIIDNKEKILVVALTPHPDIKAIRSALEKKENFEFTLYVPGITEFKEDKYDLVIFHQIPDNTNTAKNILDKFASSKTSLWFIIGNQTNLNTFNNINELVSINSRGQKDHVTPFFNSDFQKFKFENEEQSVVNTAPPVTVPFGEYKLKQDADIVLYQKLGNTVTARPLLILGTAGDRRVAVMAGEGMWEWRMHEFRETNSTKSFDKITGNIIQFLSSKEDKRKFRLYPVSNEFYISDPILFEVETYNDIYERIYGQKIDLKITDEEGKTTSYSFTNTENSSRFEVKGLKQGIYKYRANTSIAGKTEASQGEFTIKELALEALNTTADHEVLRLLAKQTNGDFFGPNNIGQIADRLKEKKLSSVIHSNEELVELINLPWLFFILLLLASSEWFMRKYKGGY